MKDRRFTEICSLNDTPSKSNIFNTSPNLQPKTSNFFWPMRLAEVLRLAEEQPIQNGARDSIPEQSVNIRIYLLTDSKKDNDRSLTGTGLTTNPFFLKRSSNPHEYFRCAYPTAMKQFR